MGKKDQLNFDWCSEKKPVHQAEDRVKKQDSPYILRFCSVDCGSAADTKGEAIGSTPIRKKDGVNCQKLETPSKRNLSRKELLGILENQEYRCAISGRPLTIDNLSLDHITPYSLDGDHSIGNVHFVTSEVNFAKGALSLDEFVSLCCDVADYHRRARKQLNSAG